MLFSETSVILEKPSTFTSLKVPLPNWNSFFSHPIFGHFVTSLKLNSPQALYSTANAFSEAVDCLGNTCSTPPIALSTQSASLLFTVLLLRFWRNRPSGLPLVQFSCWLYLTSPHCQHRWKTRPFDYSHIRLSISTLCLIWVHCLNYPPSRRCCAILHGCRLYE